MTMQMMHQAFARGTADVRTAAGRLARDRDRIDRRVRDFMGSGWTGVAAKAFAEAWDDWQQAAIDVEQGLDAMGDLLAAVQCDFLEQDHASRSDLDMISARIFERLG